MGINIRKNLYLLGFTNEHGCFKWAHNPLIEGSSPTGPTTQENRAVRGFRVSNVRENQVSKRPQHVGL